MIDSKTKGRPVQIHRFKYLAARGDLQNSIRALHDVGMLTLSHPNRPIRADSHRDRAPFDRVDLPKYFQLQVTPFDILCAVTNCAFGDVTPKLSSDSKSMESGEFRTV